MLLILSARPVNEDIALQYGRLPPSFLPLGSKRLFSWQSELSGQNRIAMTIPEDFHVPTADQSEIDSLGIKLIRQPSRLTLLQAISGAVNEVGIDEPIRILYGDTLVKLPNEKNDTLVDRLIIQDTTANYPWAYVVGEGRLRTFTDDPPKDLSTRQVVCGDFTFSDPSLLIESCNESTFIDALNHYHSRKPFEFIAGQDWLDFGHLPLYFQSKKSFMVKRFFNRISHRDHSIVKQSTDTQKMRSEAGWYESLPPEIEMFTPRYGGRVEENYMAGYALEYLFHPLLSDLSVFGALPYPSWLEILGATFEFVDKCNGIRPNEGCPESSSHYAEQFFERVIKQKTWQRLETYTSSAGVSMDSPITVNGVNFQSIRQSVSEILDLIPPTKVEDIRFWHGDLFFGNMFYDFTARRIMVVDPRGQIDGGTHSIFGDRRYDIAKLSHSILGHYDKIVLDRFTIDVHAPMNWSVPQFNQLDELDEFGNLFLKQVEIRYNIPRQEVIAMTAILFFSMLPIHQDQPSVQKIMLANALRLSKLAGEQI